MPNHIKNRINGPQEVISRLLNEGLSEIDFGKVVPKPEIIVDKSIASHVKAAAQLALGLIDLNPGPLPEAHDLSDLTTRLHASNAIRQLRNGPHPKDYDDEDFAAFIQYMQAYRETGYMDWYDWNCDHWGTKWNAYSVEVVSPEEVLFETAWSAPHPVIQALASESGEEFTHEWADEDTGNNVGFRNYSVSGDFSESELSGTTEGYELAFKLRPDHSQYYQLIDGEYQYVEEDEPA